jgi:signal transduction histidine kinase/ActR/RegA family two-component response regulator
MLYFEREHGRARAEEVYTGLAGAPPLTYIRDLNNWISFDFCMRLVDALADASGDPEFPLKAGRFAMSPEGLGFAYYMFRAFATPRTGFERIVALTPFGNRAGVFSIDAITDRHLVLRYRSKWREPSLTCCRIRQGQFSALPTLWGLPPAHIVHSQCQMQGAEACVYELTWAPYSSRFWRIVAGAIAGGCASLLPWEHAAHWFSVTAWIAVGGTLGLAWAYRKRLADQEKSLEMSTRDLAGRFDDIKRLNQTLEQKVSARTRELSLASEQLKGALTRQAELLDSEMRARLEAERANRAKDRFLATLSHELRTPLSTILAQATVLAGLPDAGPRVARGASAIRRAVGAQTRLVDDLLDISRIASGKLVLSQVPVELAAVVEEAVAVARPVAEARSLTLEASIPPSLGMVLGDPIRLQEILGNLLVNAIKFTPSGGRIQVRAASGDGKAQLVVSDNGMGIRPEFLPQLFTRFVQADSSVTRSYGGLGLGLALVRYLVEAHGGTVRAESPGENQGATFSVTLPLIPAAAAPIAAAAVLPQTQHDIRGVRVLLVDDDDDTRESFALLLTQWGAEVIVAASGAAAMTALAERLPQVILCDVAMPGEDGYSFLRRVRQLPPAQGGQIPAAAVTAFTGAEDRERALAAGFQLHVTKPVDAARLAEVVWTLAAWSAQHAPFSAQAS